MSNTIELNSLTRMAAMIARSTAVQGAAAQSPAAGGRAAVANGSFLETAARICAEQAGAEKRVLEQSAPEWSGVGQTVAALPSTAQPVQTQPIQAQAVSEQSDADLEAYKRSVWEKISRLPMSASQKIGSVSIQISDAGFDAMKNDPEYEAWVLDTLKQNFLFQNPWASICGGTYTIHCFGAAKEEYRGSSWNAGYMGGQGAALFDAKAGKSFWEQRTDRHEEFTELQAKAEAWRKMLMRLRMGTPVSVAELLLGML